MNEHLLFTGDPQKAIREVESLGGHITQQLTEQVLLAYLPSGLAKKVFKNFTLDQPKNLSRLSQKSIKIWVQLREEANRSQPKRRRKPIGLKWDAPGFVPPAKPKRTTTRVVFREREDFERAITDETLTSECLVGSVAVGIIIVSGATDELKFTSAEETLVLKEVQRAMDFLINAEPRARVQFFQERHHISIIANPGNTNSLEAAEAPWRNAALGALGCTQSRDGSIEFVAGLKKRMGTKWAYVAYFTKYPLGHFAYTENEKICIDFSSDKWHPKSLGNIFAHESCHIFGAADEYDCSCNSQHGILLEPNLNCVSCGTPQKPCLMNTNDLVICDITRLQLGWDPRVFDSVLV